MMTKKMKLKAKCSKNKDVKLEKHMRQHTSTRPHTVIQHSKLPIY